jgi:hypothetical protein
MLEFLNNVYDIYICLRSTVDFLKDEAEKRAVSLGDRPSKCWGITSYMYIENGLKI